MNADAIVAIGGGAQVKLPPMSANKIALILYLMFLLAMLPLTTLTPGMSDGIAAAVEAEMSYVP